MVPGIIKAVIKVRQYKTKACKKCPSRELCTKARNGRIIERSEFAQAVKRNKDAIDGNRELYKRRQEIVEHPFGTIKRQWGFDYTLMKGKQKVDGEVGLIFISYLFRRLITILGVNGLMEAVSLLNSFCFDLMKVIKRIRINSEAFQPIFIFPMDFRLFSLNNP
jgi:hypothetical protein